MKADKNIPIPPRSIPMSRKYDFDALAEPGDSVFFAEKINRVNSSLHLYKKKHPERRFTMRIVTETPEGAKVPVKGVRVWRNEDVKR